MNTNKSAVKKLSIMIILTIITQLFMLLKNSIVAAEFGVSEELDAFNFANNIGTFVYSFIGAGISTVLMPSLGDKSKKKSINIFITIIYFIAFIFLIIMLIFRENVIVLLNGPSSNYFIDLSSNILVATLISGFLTPFIGLVSGILQYKDQFNRLRIATLITSILVVGFLLLKKEINIYYYALVILITTFINVVIHFYFVLKSGFKYKISFNLKDHDFKIMAKLFIPIVLSQGVYQLSLIIDTIIASRLGVGQVSILSYSNTVVGMINILIFSNITSFLYPRLIRSSRENDSQESLASYILFVNTLMCLLIVLFFTVGNDGIRLLFERGSFTEENTKLVYTCTLIYVVALPINASRDLVYKHFYINKDTLSPFNNSLIISVLNILLSILLSKFFGLFGVVLGTTIASFVSLGFITIRFKKKFKFKFNTKSFFIENIKVVVITLIIIMVLTVVEKHIHINYPLLNIIIVGLLAIILYVGMLVISKSKSLKVKL